jgi:hypothetical protein
MSFQRIFTAALHDAGIAEATFDAAIKREGFKSRFDWFLKAPASLHEAYNTRVAADRAGQISQRAA